MTTRTEPALVRPAVEGDADGIARVHIAAWRETYTRLLPPGALDDLGEASRAARWRQIIADDVTGVVVAARDGEIVGWCSWSDRPRERSPRTLELEGIYVLASEYGSGTGQALLDASIGTRPAFLHVAEDNPRAHAFYRRNGFHDDGDRSEYPLAGHPVVIARWVR